VTDRVVLVRRSFLVGVGLSAVGLAVGWAPDSFAAEAKPVLEEHPDLFVQIAPDGGVTIVCPRSEMGQGVRSSIPALIADELGADMARVTIVQADGDRKYGDQNTDGSHSIRGSYDVLRKIGAAARLMLVAAAAARWHVAASACVAHDHAVHHPPSKRSLGFGALAEEAAKVPVPKSGAIVLRPVSELRTKGKVLPLVDAPAIVGGTAVFGADVRLPGMLVAVVARPPVVGGRVVRFDASKALAVPGVRKVVRLPDASAPFAFKPLGGVAVLADHTWAAMRGRALLDVTWDPGANVAYESTAYHAALGESVRSASGAHVRTSRRKGDAGAALGTAARKVEAEYHTPHLAHAPMEPLVALARVEGGRCECWAPTQNPQAARTEVAKALGVDESAVTIHVTLLGGGFGRKSKPDYVVEAALLAREAGVPVRVQWTREDDVRHDYYHSTSAQRMVAGLDAQNRVVAWHHRDAFPSIGSTFSGATFGGEGEMQQGVTDLPLAVPNVLVEVCEAKAMTRIGWLRSVANVYHAFAVQTFMDELAAARGVDPVDNLRDLLGPARVVSLDELGMTSLPNYGQPLAEHPIDVARHHRVLARAAAMSRWTTRNAEGRALGIAVHRSFLAYVAVVVAVSQGKDGVRVDEAWIVADVGTTVNIERVRSQLEGAVVFGLSLALFGEITMKDGATVQSNFRDFRLLRIGQAPRAIHVDVVENEGPSGGVGEPGVPPVAPALTNAIFALTGTRIRTLPVVRSLPVA
jgi:isoquinoline 1-oxidoreductase beta subunit